MSTDGFGGSRAYVYPGCYTRTLSMFFSCSGGASTESIETNQSELFGILRLNRADALSLC